MLQIQDGIQVIANSDTSARQHALLKGNQPFIVVELPSHLATAWQRLLGRTGFCPHEETAAFRTTIFATLGIIPGFIHRTVRGLWKDGVAAVLIKGLPVGDLGPTPKSAAERPSKGDSVSEGVLLGIAAHLTGGEPFSFLAEAGGVPIHNVAADPKFAGKPAGTGSGPRLGWHNEAAFHEARPDAIAIFNLRGNPKAITTVASVRDAVRMLTAAQIAELRTPQFLIGIPYTFAALGGGSASAGPLPVLEGPHAAPESRVNFVSTKPAPGASPGALNALLALEAAMELARQDFVLMPGDLLLINNRAAVHGRSAFRVNEFGGTSRWLQRVYVSRDIRRQAADKGIRTFQI